jgi:hypothetical protein
MNFFTAFFPFSAEPQTVHRDPTKADTTRRVACESSTTMILKLICWASRFAGSFEGFEPYYFAILAIRPEYRVSINQVLRVT